MSVKLCFSNKHGSPQVRICDKCKKWKDAILDNHNNKHNEIHWKNCQPQLWPTHKWEVAKAYMIRGIKDHHGFDQFDISAILNFMAHCKHFKAFTEGNCLIQVITMRNKMMHSPDFTFSKQELDGFINNVQKLAEVIEKHAPGQKDISKNIQKDIKKLRDRVDRLESDVPVSPAFSLNTSDTADSTGSSQNEGSTPTVSQLTEEEEGDEDDGVSAASNDRCHHYEKQNDAFS
ncbi:uncharacterized protein CXorf38 homolog isoform X2 [Neoarius graeffei]|uniref:uncharacterized protein CXorf38 homolog isoform X2 n=1 Tax=Neoarius graeffei TaxID=443677 RepID=UPI00298BE5C5|nr:uncharacterized protein CXorf38 homolog isoform X2 [Neoarius graeffei]